MVYVITCNTFTCHVPTYYMVYIIICNTFTCHVAILYGICNYM